MRSAKKLNKQTVITLAILASLITIALVFVGFFYAKYIKELNFSGNVTISADLCESFTLTEHKVTQRPDGSYVVESKTAVTENEYYVLPGIDIPKDPTVEITGKTAIDSYLFIEVVDRVDHEIISFSLDSHWQEVTDAVPKNGGKVYVFCVDGAPAVLNDKTDKDLISSIGIIKDDTLNVTEDSIDADGKTIMDFYSQTGVAVDLDFYGYLVQINEGESVAQVFNKLAPAG